MSSSEGLQFLGALVQAQAEMLSEGRKSELVGFRHRLAIHAVGYSVFYTKVELKTAGSCGWKRLRGTETPLPGIGPGR